MTLEEFIEKKYQGGYFDIKKANKEFLKNEKNKKRYFALKSAGKTNSWDFLHLKDTIIW